ncbi:Murein DD-endopeptidase MepM and murein hydrolase activator NlpD, contain LysM domain [Devosia enhydra]|uniref:Murein DD-endopeptidase MepM and murein hydrolase activator NlpD, contain LysM domain n=1 Tax=Devosia enhydra TaxID=665118 RepID=A0A1K2I0S6_9HYPH|nr:M23 family metallopeptidase [Devosia enhydra]SFZ85803.1 Murein DD-endopeptidase MepM and murein hydrolase activator NlpD, contain LysM domain [Devosia enhydra]
MNPAQRNRTAALLKASGYEDSPALTVQSTDGEIPHGRELSFAWLTGTVMTGLTSVLLMGAALYVSFKGQDTFSTAYEALQIVAPQPDTVTGIKAKTHRMRPVAQTRSELEIVEASIRESVDGRDMIRKQPFVRIRATLATAATALSDDVPAYDPVAILDSNAPIEGADSGLAANTQIYGADVEGEVSIRLAALPATLVPPRLISDRSAAEFARATVENLFGEGDYEALAYADTGQRLRELDTPRDGQLAGVVENVTAVPKTTTAEDAGLGRTERILTMRERTPLADTLSRNGFTPQMVAAVSATLRNILPTLDMPSGARLRILFGPSRVADSLIPYRLSIYFHDNAANIDKHAATVALTDRGSYVLGLAPPDIEFPEEDTEEINVNNLPSVYRSIWETARKHDVDDATTSRIVAMFAYDIDLTRKIAPGDSIEILQTAPNAEGRKDLLYVALKLGSTTREFYRFRTNDGTVDFFDTEGQTGKRFLTRRPVEGGGRLSSRYGYRVHPIFKTRRLHSGIDLAAPRNTPIYAAGDGVVERAQWVSGYGRYVELRHVNGFETAYGHMNKIADGMKPGTRVRQGQIVGYVGSTGNSTGNHLHFEIKVNGRTVDPLSVKLPRDKSLPASAEQAFEQTVAQIKDLMQRDPAPVTVAAIMGQNSRS